jgi:transcriptional regulator with XRE-family HTH domain
VTETQEISRGLSGAIREAMKARGMSQRDLASASGMSLSGVWRILDNDRVPSMTTVCRLARALRVDLVFDHDGVVTFRVPPDEGDQSGSSDKS